MSLLDDLIAENEEVKQEQYHNKVVALIREKYSQNDEYKILRTKLAGNDTGEFEEYNAYVEECKKKANI